MNIILNNFSAFNYNKINRNAISFKQNKQEVKSCAKPDNASCDSLPESEKTRKTALGYEKEAPELCNFSYVQKEEAEKLLKNAVKIMNAYNITGYKPVNKKEYYDSGKLSYEIFSNSVSAESDGTNMGVNYIYDTVLKNIIKAAK